MAPPSSSSPSAIAKGALPPSAAAETVTGRGAAADPTWAAVRRDCEAMCAAEPVLTPRLHATVLSQRSLEQALAARLADKLACGGLSAPQLAPVLCEVLEKGLAVDNLTLLGTVMRHDLAAVVRRDPACPTVAHCFLFFKGFLGLTAHRVAHWLYEHGRLPLAYTLQSRVSEVFGMDIHPGAKIGSGVMLDHATGLVVGQTAVIGDDCTLLHGVTLGGTGKVTGDRHPKLGRGVTIGAGATVLGNIKVGDGATVAACSVVVKAVPPGVTVVGSPAKVVSPVTAEKLHLPKGVSEVQARPRL